MKFIKSFYCAGRGILEAAKGRNFRIMLCIGALAVLFAKMFCELEKAEWAVLMLTCGAVLSVEAVNTAIENLSDKVTREKDALIGKCKDCSAGASLIASIFAAAVGIKLLWSETAFERAVEYFSEPIRIAVLAGILVLMVLFIVLPEVVKKRYKAENNSL